MRIAITGASGNVGTALLRELPRGHEVIGIARRRPPEVDPYARAQWRSIDLSEPSAAGCLVEAFAGVDVVVHLAWMIQPQRDRDLLHRANAGGSDSVVRAARASGVRHLVHMSSVGVYGASPQHRFRDESWPTIGIPRSSYSVDKVAAEAALAGLDGSGTALSVVRPSLILQPEAASEIARYFLGRLVPVSLARQPLLRLAPWPPALRLQFVHARDVADALVRIVERTATGPFNLAADPVIDRGRYRAQFGGVGPPAPIALARLGASAGYHARLTPIEPGWIDLAANAPLMDAGRARRELDWRPRHRGDQTLSEFVSALSRREGGHGPLLHRRRLIAG